MQLWEITGQSVSNRDNGGLTVVYAITQDASDFPDVDRALESCDPSSKWLSVENVNRCGELPMAWIDGERTVRLADHLTDQVVKATRARRSGQP